MGPSVRPEALLSTLTQLRAENSLLQENLTAQAAAHGAQLRRTLDGGAVPLVLPGGNSGGMRDDDLDGRIAAEGFAYELEEVGPSTLLTGAAHGDGGDVGTTVTERLVAVEARAALSLELEADAVLDELLTSAAVIDSELRSLIAQADASQPTADMLGPIDDLLAQAADLELAAAEAVAERAAAAETDDDANDSPTPAAATPNGGGIRAQTHKVKLEALRQRTQALEAQLMTSVAAAESSGLSSGGDAALLPSVHALADAVDAALVEVLCTEAVRLDVERVELDHVIELLETDPELGQATELATTLRLEAQRGGLPSSPLLHGGDAPLNRLQLSTGSGGGRDGVALRSGLATRADPTEEAIIEAGAPALDRNVGTRKRQESAHEVAMTIAAAAVEVAASHDAVLTLTLRPSSTAEVARAAARAFAEASAAEEAGAAADDAENTIAADIVFSFDEAGNPVDAEAVASAVDVALLEEASQRAWAEASEAAAQRAAAAKAAALASAKAELEKLQAVREALERAAAERAAAAKVEQQRQC